MASSLESFSQNITPSVDINTADKEGYSPLHYVFTSKQSPDSNADIQLETLKLLISHGADINMKTKDGSTVLHLAVRKDMSLKIIEYLIEKGVSIDETDNNKHTAFYYSVMPVLCSSWSSKFNFVKSDITKLLLSKGTDITTDSFQGYGAVLAAVILKREDVVEDILNSLQQSNRYLIESTAPETPLTCERSVNDEKIEQITSGTKKGYTPLSFAVQFDNLKIVQSLVKAGANVNGVIENDSRKGFTPLLLAIRNQKVELAKCFLESGASVNALTPMDPEYSQYGERSSLHLIMNDAYSWFNHHPDVFDFVKLIIEKKIDFNIKEKTKGRTVLHMAITNLQEHSTMEHLKSHPNLPTLFVNSGADINIQDNDGKTPLHLSIEESMKWNTGRYPVNQALELTKLLLTKGAGGN